MTTQVAKRRARRLVDGVDLVGCDGIQRSVEAERDLNETFSGLFAGDGGQKALDYLRAVTLLNVQGAAISDGELRHLEGQRFAVALIERRIALGRQHKPELPSEKAPGAT